MNLHTLRQRFLRHLNPLAKMTGPSSDMMPEDAPAVTAFESAAASEFVLPPRLPARPFIYFRDGDIIDGPPPAGA